MNSVMAASLQSVWRLRILKLERKVPLAPLSTKAKKPVRYTSIKKAKPKTIVDIGKLLQEKTKETKDKNQSVITAAALKAATNTAKPATPNQSDAGDDVAVNTSTSTSPAKAAVYGSSVAATHVDEGPTQDTADLGAVKPTKKKASAVDPTDTKDGGQISMATKRLAKEKYAGNVKEMTHQAVDLGVKSSPVSTFGSPEVSTQSDVTEEVRRAPELQQTSTDTKAVSPSNEDVTPVSKDVLSGATVTPEVAASDETVHSPSRVMVTPEVLAVHDDDHLEVSAGPETELKRESFVVMEGAAAGIASTSTNAQLQSTQSPESGAATWFPEDAVLSSNVRGEEPFSGHLSFSDTAADSKSNLDIPSAETAGVISCEVPPLPEIFLDKALAERISDPPSSENVNEPVLVQNVSEDEVQTDAVAGSPEAQLDPIQRLFLNKIHEYSIKSQASGGLVDAGPEYEKAFSEELAKLQRFYGGGDLTSFPEFEFTEPKLDEVI